MLRYFVLLLALLQMQATFADETTPTKSTSPDDIAKLIDRIDQLEKRIKELERQASRPQTVTVVPQYPAYYQQAPSSPTPYVPQTIPASPYQASPYQPPYQPNRTVPDSWKPFNFNGMQYYIIPVDEADRMNRPQSNDRTNR